jgi:hypothetical protein
MKKKLIILFLLLVPIIGVFYSCCDCKPPVPASYSHKTLLLKNLDNNGKWAVETDSLQINKNAYGIRFYLTREKDIIACERQINSIFIQSAYAFSVPDCYDYIYSATDRIVSIKIFTLNDFDNQHSGNSDITDYFRVAQTYSNVDEFLKTLNYSYEWNEFETFPWKNLIFDLMLMVAPTATNNQQFKVQVELSDGRILEQQTTEIKLL